MRKFVLFSLAGSCIGDWLNATPRERRAWSVGVLPLDLYQLLERNGVQLCGADAAYLSDAIERAGVRADVARKWPQAIGYRAALLLAERGRVAFALLCGRDARRGARARVGVHTAAALRVETDELLRALRAAGNKIPHTKKEGECAT